MSHPLPVAGLLRRARNAKSPKERHDSAYFALEASIRIACAARPPQDASNLAMPSIGHFVSALELPELALDAAPVLELHQLLTSVAQGKPSNVKSVSPRRLLEAVPAYRNQVLGHGSVRTNEFYDSAGHTLLDGVEACWALSLFLPREARLVYVESIELGADGSRRGRVVDLSGAVAQVEDPRGTKNLPAQLLPRCIYVREAESWRPAHPWLLFQEADLRERVLFFNGRGKSGSQFLDYIGGEALKGKALQEAFPQLEDAVLAVIRAPAAAAPSTESEKADASLFGDYKLLGKLGEGGMGVVYLARQESLGRLVALKMLSTTAEDPVASARFRREVTALSRCDHPNIVKILAAGETDGRLYYAMELVEGADLAQLVAALSSTDNFDVAVSTASERVRRAKADVFANVPNVPGHAQGHEFMAIGGEPTRKLAALFRDAARGLHYLHERGVLHRDVKPANLMVTQHDHRLVLMDLGLAALSDVSRSITRDKSTLLGTLRYMSPEQLQSALFELDRRADVYGLGATFWELFTGEPMFDGETDARLVEQILREEPRAPWEVNPKLPRELGAILVRATRKDRKDRYDSGEELAQDLDAFLAGRPVLAGGTMLGTTLRRRRRTLEIALTVALVATGAGWLYTSRTHSAESLELARATLDDREKLLAEALGATARSAGRDRDVVSEALWAARALKIRENAEARGQILSLASSERPKLTWRSAVRPTCARLALLGDGSGVQCTTAAGVLTLDPRTGAQLSDTGLRGVRVTTSAIGSHSLRLALAGEDGFVRLRENGSGKELARIYARAQGRLSALAFSGDETLIAAVNERGQIFVRTLDGVDAAWRECTQVGHAGPINAIVELPGVRFATAGDDGTVRIFDGAAPDAPATVVGHHRRPVLALAATPDGSLLVSGSRDHTATLWNLATGRSWPIDAHPAAVVAVAVMPDASVVATAGEDRTVRLFGTTDLVRRLELKVRDGVATSIALAQTTEGGPVLLVAPPRANVERWELPRPAAGPLSASVCPGGTAASTLAPGGVALACSGPQGTMNLWHVGGAEASKVSPPPGSGEGARPLTAIALSAEAKHAVVATSDGAIARWTAETDSWTTLTTAAPPVRALSVSDDGGRVAWIDAKGGVTVWDVEKAAVRLHRTNGWARGALALSPSGANVAYGAEGSTAVIATVDADGAHDQVLTGHDDGVEAIAFSSGGARIATGSADGTTRIWDLAGRPVALFAGSEGEIRAVAFSPDGRMLATGAADRAVRLWSLDQLALRATLRGHEDGVLAVGFVSDDTLVTGSEQGDVRAWSLALLNAPAAELEASFEGLFGARLDDDGKVEPRKPGTAQADEPATATAAPGE